jgi:hypothetical protein
MSIRNEGIKHSLREKTRYQEVACHEIPLLILQQIRI